MVKIPRKIAVLIRSHLRAFGTVDGFRKQKDKLDLESWNSIVPWMQRLGDDDVVGICIQLFPEINFDKVKMASNMLIEEELSTQSSFTDLHKSINKKIRSSAVCSKLYVLKNLVKELERDEENPIDFDVLQGCTVAQSNCEIWPQDFQPCSNILCAEWKEERLCKVALKNTVRVLDGDDFLDQVSENHSSATPEVATRVFTFLEYKLDQYLNVPNFAVVHEMKDRIANSTPPPRVNHLLNFWLANGFPFSDFVVFFQYLYYHVERLECVDTLSFKTYEHLVDAIVRREHIFQSHHELVSNIPLMCQYKFLIFDDNYPEYVLINPELLTLQMYPLVGGLPTAVMYLFKDKRKWLISDLRKEFSDCREAEFYRQLCNFLNDRPDLVMLQSPRLKEKLHLRNDHIKSMKQFIPYR
uniref:Uncharacterized protein n=1 Tax=Panagrolaimus davidi TaxID=227884 RepID=A0A914P6X1_9BILA